ncbi:MAG: hypothetical protein K2P58_05245 [Hyphomonadaceae bacterium]|nr:hypothetical protein [Hyphomonadaceae bacterium]
MTGPKDVVIEPPKRKGRPLVWLAAIVFLAVGVVAGWYARDFFAVNACLDAGGAWTAPGVCVGAVQ